MVFGGTSDRSWTAPVAWSWATVRAQEVQILERSGRGNDHSGRGRTANSGSEGYETPAGMHSVWTSCLERDAKQNFHTSPLPSLLSLRGGGYRGQK